MNTLCVNGFVISAMPMRWLPSGLQLFWIVYEHWTYTIWVKHKEGYMAECERGKWEELKDRKKDEGWSVGNTLIC